MAKKKTSGRVTTGSGGIGTPAKVGLGAPRPNFTPTGPGTAYPTPPPFPSNPYTAPAPPIDPAYEAYKVSAGRSVALADADATYQNARLENLYGLGADTSNPYSRGKLLAENLRRSQRGTEGSYANMGQQYSGAYQVAQGENTRNYSIGYDQLARDYADQKKGVLRGQLGTYAQYGTGVDEAQFQSLLKALGG